MQQGSLFAVSVWERERPLPCQTHWACPFLCLQLDTEKLEKIPILKELRALEEQLGKDVTLGEVPAAREPGLHAGPPKRQTRRRPRQNTQQDDEGESRQENRGEGEQRARQRPPRVRKESKGDGRREDEGEGGERGKGRGGWKEKGQEEREGEAGSQRKLPLSVTTVYLGGIPAGIRVSELKTALREREAAPLRLTWQGAQHRAFLDYSDPQIAEQALEALQGLSLNGQSLQAELAKSQRGGKRSGQSNRRPRSSVAEKPKVASTDSQGDAAEETEQ